MATLGRLFVALAMIAFGIQHLIYLDFVTRVVPPLPPWIPGHSILASVFGLFLVVAGLAMLSGKGARTAALLLGGVILISFTVLYIPLLFANPLNGGVWTKAGKALALAGASFLVAGRASSEVAILKGWLLRALEWFIRL